MSDKPKYIIAQAGHPDDLASVVRESLTDGYIPVGGLCCAPAMFIGMPYITLMQALVLADDATSPVEAS